ncbi:hypothetical protein NDU88_010172 [Pleurodeles waltl]|uniref:Uncharacterized protein n=1 Tax=Pleurodeles waltl TaxID=8319 RepID=A0AAV7QZP1_PLEWA|nr:hypothetical protein NDU88_010172 [Pleurodeles waltl]
MLSLGVSVRKFVSTPCPASRMGQSPSERLISRAEPRGVHAQRYSAAAQNSVRRPERAPDRGAYAATMLPSE